MSRSPGTTVENNFVKGIVTEFSGLNFPENSCQDALNIVFTEKGEVVRRPAIDLETSYQTYSLPTTIRATAGKAFRTFLWKNAEPQSNTDLVVVQTENLISFYRTNGQTISAQKLAFVLDLTTYRTSAAFDLRFNDCQFASGDSQLFIVHPYTDTLKVIFNPSTLTFTVSVVKVKIRDFFVFQPEIANDVEQVTTDPKARYNAKNQGWNDTELAAFSVARAGALPSKAQLPWFFKLANGTLNYSPILKLQVAGNSLATRGFYILDAFYQDRSAASGIAGLDVVSSNNIRPSVVAFFNSRIFLSGVNSEGYTGKVYFSKIIKDRNDEVLFHQVGDPTSEINFALLPNDGGVIDIPEAGRIFALRQVRNAMFVFAANGIWAIQGNEGVGFTATDFSVEKVSDQGLNSSSSIVSVDNIPVFWTATGIHTIQGNPVAGNLDMASITKTTIQSLYDAIPVDCKRHAKGAYDPITKEVYWLYSNNGNDPTAYNRVLCFRVNTQAFYVFSISEANAKVKDIFTLSGSSRILIDDNVVTGTNDNVVTGLGDQVTVQVESLNSIKTSFKLLTVIQETGQLDKVTFGLFDYTDPLQDWITLGSPVTFTSYAVSSYKLRGEGHRPFQIHYVTVFSKMLPGSSVWLSTIWDYTNSPDTGRFTNRQQAIKYDNQKDYNSRRLLIRGNGVSVQFKFESDGTSPFNIIGWSTSESVNDRV